MFTHRVRVRYAEVDLQGVVFNAHYLTWVDDAMSAWLAAVGYRGASWGDDEPGAPDEEGWDLMVRHATLDWRGSAGFGDVVDIDCEVPRWGTTSFDVRFGLRVEDRPVVDIVLTYVGVRTDPDTGATTKATVPARLRRGLSSTPVPPPVA